MAIEKIQAEVIVEAKMDKQSFNKAQNETRVFARDTKKELDREFLVKLQIDRANLQVQLDDVKARLRQAKKEGDQQAVIDLTVKSEKLKSELTESGRRLQNYRNTGDVQISRLQAKFNETNKTIRSQGGVIDFVKGKLLAFGGVLAGVFAARTVLNFANQVDRARSEIVKATGASGEALEGLQDVANNVFRQVPESIDVVGKAIGDINTRFGATGKELEVLTKDFLDFARITGQDVQQAIRGASRLLQDWGVQTEDTSYLLDILTKAGQETGVSINTLTTNLTNSGVQLRTLGFNLEESVALLSKFEKEGVNTQGILAGLNRGVNELAKQTGQTIPQAFSGFIESIKTAETEAKALAIANEVLGSRAGPQLALAVREGRFEIDDFVKSLQNSEGALSRTAREALTLEQRMKIAGNQIKSEFIPILESIIPIAFRVIDSFSKIRNSFTILSNVIQGGVLSIIQSFQELGIKAIATFQDLAGNTRIVVDNILGLFTTLIQNIGIAFGNLPSLVQDGLNGLLRATTNTVNKSLGLLNTIPGVDLSLKSPTIDLAPARKEFIKFSDNIQELDNRNRQNAEKQISFLKQEYDKQYSDIANNIKNAYNDIQNITEEATKRRTATEKKAVEDALGLNDELVEKTGGGAKKRVEQEEDLLKEIERIQKEHRDLVIENEKKRNEKTKDTLKGLEDGYKTIAKVYDDSIKASEKRTQDFVKEIENLQKAIAGIESELNKLEEGRADTLGKRNLEIEKELENLRAEEQQDMQAINKLLEEQRLIQANATKEELDEARRLASLSPTALFLEQFEAKKKALEEDRLLKLQEVEDLQQQKADEEAILDAFNQKKQDLDSKYEEFKKQLESRITDNLMQENQKRINSLKELEQQAIRTAQALASAGASGVSTSGDNTSNTINNSPTVVVNANVSSQVDVDNLGNELANKITLSSKGID